MIATYNHAQFLPLSDLCEQKVRAGVRVSVIIPALNEAMTVGPIVECVRAQLVEEVALVDELVVIDGRSTDRTVEVATAAGARVISIDEIPVERGVTEGKGTALWKGLLATTGDIIVCIDADIRQFAPCFVYGLLGPLLQDESLMFVKGSYLRPLVLGSEADVAYGGRVTEILVRPLLSAFMPDLARLSQPLGGEYAFRRSAAESLPFCSGYGVEIGLVLDMYRRYGLASFAQVEMGIRYHRNRPVVELGRMSFGVMQTMMGRLAQDGRLSLTAPLSELMVSPLGKAWEETTIVDVELPSIAEYRKGFR